MDVWLGCDGGAVEGRYWWLVGGVGGQLVCCKGDLESMAKASA